MRYLAEITKQLRADDLHVDFDNVNDAIIWIGQNGFTDDGYRVIAYDAGQGGTLREGSKAVLEVDGVSTEYDTLAKAQAAAPDYGYRIIDLEQPVGSKSSILIEAMPSLTHTTESEYVASRANGWGRTDGDRF
jgi:hypothetical protein